LIFIAPWLRNPTPGRVLGIRLPKPRLLNQGIPDAADWTREGHRWLAETFQLPLEKYNYPKWH